MKFLDNGFFKPLAAQKIDEYWVIVSTIYDHANGGAYSMSKELLKREIERKNIDNFYAKIETLKETSWINENTDNEYKEICHLSSEAIETIEMVRRWENKEFTNFSGELQGIVSELKTIETQDQDSVNPYTLFQKVESDTNNFIKNLRDLDTNIGFYINKIDDLKTSNKILSNLIDYEEFIIDKGYHELFTKNNYYNLKRRIGEIIDRILDSQHIIENIATFSDSNDSQENIIKDLRRRFLNIQDKFENQSVVIDGIENQNKKYYLSSFRRANFLTTNSSSESALIKDLLKIIANCDNESELLEDLNKSILITEYSLIDDNSLYKYPEITERTEEETIQFIEADKHYTAEEMLKMTNFEYSKDELLKNVNYPLRISDLPLKNKEDFKKMVLITAYSEIGSIFGEVSRNGYTHTDAELLRGK